MADGIEDLESGEESNRWIVRAKSLLQITGWAGYAQGEQVCSRGISEKIEAGVSSA
jgi:predicted chitinase